MEKTRAHSHEKVMEKSPPFSLSSAFSLPSVFLLLKTMRPHQWTKNLLLFAPFVLAHQLNRPDKISVLVMTFICMCLMASGIYLVNDLFDAKADRLHPVKKRRPIASGALHPGMAATAAFSMLVVSLVGAARFAGLVTAALLAVYGLLSTAYTVRLKRYLMIDVIILSFFYVFRIIIGGQAARVTITPWFLAFSFFFFLSLAFIKRYAELKTLARETGNRMTGRGYRTEDMQIMPVAGVASGLLSVLVFLLYIATNEQVKALYPHPLWLWAAGPVFVYWIMRAWFLTQRDEMHSDPVTFAITDPPSWISAVTVTLFLILGALK